MHYWSVDSFGSGPVPENYEEIIDKANEMISAYAETHDEEETENYSSKLWDRYCMTESLSD